jgi:TolB-like protein/DNA-binding winged helix-turn-helix (wHTH) protein/predicted Zn-dependent protease
MVYHFADCELDERLYQLRREGALVAVEPKVFGVLAYLVHHHDRVISKDELLEKLWPGQVVGEAALSRCIGAARKAVGDDGDRQAIIETQHGRGYRFIAPVTEPHESSLSSPSPDGINSVTATSNGQFSEALFDSLPLPAGQETNEHAVSVAPVIVALPGSPSPVPTEEVPSRRVGIAHRSWPLITIFGILLIAGTVLVVQYFSARTLSPQSSAPITQPLTPNPQPLSLPDKPSIIVLPFVNLSGDPGQEYFSDGMTEDITGSLSRLASLFVIARTSAFTYKGKAAKAQDINREMGVRYILEGSVLKADGQVRITTQLIDASTGYHLWSERYDRPLQNILTLQDEIVQKIVTTLKLQLTLQEQGWIVRKHTDNLEAYDTFLRGQESYFRYTKEANAQARQMYEKAITLDPRYAEAYAWLGRAYILEWASRWNTDPKTLERALALEQQALALDDSLPRAHSFLGMIYAEQQQYDQAIAEGELAIALDPNNVGNYAGQANVLTTAGRPEEAIRMLEQAMRLNPRYPPVYLSGLGLAYNLTGQYTEAITALKAALSRSPNLLGTHLTLAISYVQQWAYQQGSDAQTLEHALAAAKRAIALNDSLPSCHVILGYVYLLQKHYEQAIAEMERAIALHPNVAGGYAVLAEMLSRVSKSEEAVGMVEQALRRKPLIADQHLINVGTAYYLAEKPAEAVTPLQQFLARYPNIPGAHLSLAAVYSELGKEAEAQVEATEVLRLSPQFSLAVHKERVPIKNPARLERHLAALRKAGLT